jgi:branched-chain amino acid aminotransferase
VKEFLMVLPEKSLIDMLKKEGINVEVRPVLVSELVEAKNGTLKEIFGAGTAAVVNPLLIFIPKCLS